MYLLSTHKCRKLLLLKVTLCNSTSENCLLYIKQTFCLVCNSLQFSKLRVETDLQLSETVREPSAGLYVVVPSYLGKCTCDCIYVASSVDRIMSTS